jgi:hypothetical protein
MFYKSALDRTDYYGESGKAHSTKLYNKAAEAGLDGNLTRLEVKLGKGDLDFDESRKYFEALSVLRYGTGVGLVEGLTQNDRVTLELLNLHPEYLSRYNWAARKKFEPYLTDFLLRFELDRKAFLGVVCFAMAFRSLDVVRIFDD